MGSVAYDTQLHDKLYSDIQYLDNKVLYMAIKITQYNTNIW